MKVASSANNCSLAPNSNERKAGEGDRSQGLLKWTEAFQIDGAVKLSTVLESHTNAPRNCKMFTAGR